MVRSVLSVISVMCHDCHRLKIRKNISDIAKDIVLAASTA